MKDILRIKINRQTAKNHTKSWFLYLISVWGINWIGSGSAHILGVSLMVAGMAATVYFIVHFSQSFLQGRSTFILVAGSVTAFFLLMSITYIVVYVVLPYFGIFLYIEGKTFTWGKFIQFCFKNYEAALLTAIAILAYRKQRDTLINQVELEKIKNEVEAENKRLELAALARQLGSHWLHAVHLTMKVRLAAEADMAYIYERLLLLEEYHYKDLANAGYSAILLEHELNYLELMKEINDAAYPRYQPVILEVRPQPVARLVPRLLLGTFLENAFSYADQTDPEHPIRIFLDSNRERLLFSCENKINASKRSLASTKVGLINVRRQLDLMHPGNYDLDIEENNAFFKVTLIIYYHA